MTALLVNTCPSCGAEESLDATIQRCIDNDDTRRLVADICAVSLPLGALAVRYVRLHKPAKHQLSMAKVHKVLMELVPDMQRASLERDGRVYATPAEAWKHAFQVVFDAVDRGQLKTPLQHNGYLYGVLTRQAEGREAKAEDQRDADLRHGFRAGSVHVAPSAPVSAAAAPPPAPRAAAPMPEAVRALRDSLKRPTPATGHNTPPEGADSTEGGLHG